MRAKWSAPIRKYWKISEQMMVKYCDLAICDSVNIEKYIHECYDGKGIKGRNPKTTFIAYGADLTLSKLADDDEKLMNWYREKGLTKKDYYLVVGRFVPENSFEVMIREFMKSKSKKNFAIITNVNEKFLNELEEKLHFKSDKRIKFVGTVYDQELLKKIRENVKRKEGQFIGSFAGYGYRKDPKDKNHLIIDEYAAGIVQEIFKQKLNGMSSQRIASHLNELGVLPPNEYKRANGFNYTCGFQAGLNQKWTVVSVNRILKNESYTGTLIQGKRRKINYKVKKSHDVGSENWIRVEDAHDAIISKGEFQQVQQLLELDTRTAPSQTTVYP